MIHHLRILALAQALQLAFCPVVFSRELLAASKFVSPNTMHFSLPINGPLVASGAYSPSAANTLKPTMARADATPVAASGLAQLVTVAAPLDGPIVIDNDEQTQVVEEFKWQELADEPGRTRIDAGAQFPINVITELSSKSARVGDPVQARLKADLKIGGKLIAPRGATVMGHVSTVRRSRRLLVAELSPHEWFRANGAIGLQFDEIVTSAGEHLPLVATPAQTARIVKNKAEGRVLGINQQGQVAPPLSMQLKAQAIHLAVRGAASAGGVFSFGAVPVVYATLGAMNPDFAFMHPVGKNVPHRRLKGFAMGLVSGAPGGFLIADTILRGQEAVVKPGDEFLAEFKESFTGEAVADASLIPGARIKVHGEVLPDTRKHKK